MTLSDKFGNSFIIEHTSTGTRVIKLKLASQPRARVLGTVDPKTKTFFVERVREKHLLKKIDGYGFNHYILSNAKLFDSVYLSDNYSEWEIPVKVLLETKDYKFFKKQGFELQVFITLDELEPYKVRNRF